MRILAIILLASLVASAAVPRPLPDHPGNIFVAGEHVIVPVSATTAGGEWKLTDYDHKSTNVTVTDGHADLGELRVGYYELRHGDDVDRTTVGVIAPLAAPTPVDSPISIDVAMAWIYKDPAVQPKVISLCQIAGVNWVRDRLSWPDLEPTKGHYADRNIYDETAEIQSNAGLRVLQVNHISPPWASKDGRHFPPDLRDAYEFNRAMAARFKGKILALEPWNEADIKEFGGHTGSEMATLQKAAYWGQKAGNPGIITCENVFAIARQTTLDDFGANDASPYFDTYNLHHYVPLEKYDAYYAAHRAVSGGKPMWVTECNITVWWSGDPAKQEPSEQELRFGARRMAKIFATSIYEGSVNTFYFMLPHYVERQLQYGLLHPDLTPRPAYVAFAAVGRLLAGAKPLGRLKTDDPNLKGYLFRAMPDGHEKYVFVTWFDGKSGDKTLMVDAQPAMMFDNLGRQPKAAWTGKMKLESSPQFLIFDTDPSSHLSLNPPPQPPARSDGKPSPIVLQALPTTKTILDQSAFAMDSTEPLKVPLFIYNFGDKPAHGELRATGPAGWNVQLEPAVKDVAPGARMQLADLVIDSHGAAAGIAGSVRIDGDFGDGGKVVLSVRFIAESKESSGSSTKAAN